MGRLRPEFDLQAHRGGAGLVTENTLAAFANALTIGVTTLEFDCHVSADGVPVVVHDAALPGLQHCVGDLTLAQLKAIDIGGLRAEEFPGQRQAVGAEIPTLLEVFELVDSYRSTVAFNIEIKYDALAPDSGASKEAWVAAMAESVADRTERVTIQAFDWSTLVLMAEAQPAVRLSALTSPKYLRADASQRSPWLAGLDLLEFGGDPVAAAAQLGFHQLSPIHGYPYRSGVENPAYRPFTTPDLVAAAHAAEMTVVPYVVDDPATMRRLIEVGCDGLITNYPDVLRAVLVESGESVSPPIQGTTPVLG